MEKVTTVTFSDRLKSLMGKRGLKNVDVAKAVGLSHVAIGHYIRGDRMPGAMELYKIAKFFGVQMEWFIEGEIDKVETIQRTTAVSAAVVEESHVPEGERQMAFNELVTRFLQLEQAMREMRDSLVHTGAIQMKAERQEPEQPASPSSVSDVAGAKLLKKGVASVPGPSPTSSQSHEAAAPSARTSSPKHGAGKDSKGKPQPPTPAHK